MSLSIKKLCHEKTCHEKTRSDTNWAVQPQKMARYLQFWIGIILSMKRDYTIYIA